MQIAADTRTTVEKIAGIAAKLDNCREEAARALCLAAGKDFDNASHYAEAVTEAARRYGRFTDEEQALISSLTAPALHNSNQPGEKSLHSTASGYNPEHEPMGEKAARELYGLWQSIERGIKRLKNDPLEAIRNRRHEIEREVKETKGKVIDVVKNTAGLFLTEAAAIYLANRLKEIDAGYIKCGRRREESRQGTCNQIAGNEFSELLRAAARMPGLSEKTKFKLLQIAKWPQTVRYPHIRKDFYDFIKKENEQLLKYLYFLERRI